MPPAVHGRFSEEKEGPLRDLSRTIEFYGRVTKIYGSYKVTQLRALAMRLQGASPQQIKEQLWDQQHTWAGQKMYELAISLRGFYLKVMLQRHMLLLVAPHRPCSTGSVERKRAPAAANWAPASSACVN
jgi:hypothetical protein